MKYHNQLVVINNLKSGDKQVLEKLYKEFRQEFISWIIKTYGCDLDDARDIYQYAILTFYKNACEGKLDELSSSIKTYLFAIGKNQIRKRNKEKVKYSDQLLDIIVDESETIRLDKIEYEQKIIRVADALNELGDSCRQILEFTYFFKFNMNEISEKLGYKNRDTVKNLKYKCLQRLKKLILKRSENIKMNDYE